MVNMPVPVTPPPTGLVTVISLAPLGAKPPTSIFTVSWVAFTKAVLFIVIPVPPKETVAPFWKSKPFIVTFKPMVPCAVEVGLIEDKDGGGREFTVNPPARTPDWLSGFATITFQVPIAAPVRLNKPPFIVVLFKNVNPEPAMSDSPVLVSFTVAPDWK